MSKGSSNPRYGTHYQRRAKLRKRVAAEGRPCAICGRPIDYSLDWWVDPKDKKRKRHPLSYELDEIVPISKGGSPIDYDNVQPAHRICNQRKGNRTDEREPESESEGLLQKVDAEAADVVKLPTSRAW